LLYIILFVDTFLWLFLFTFGEILHMFTANRRICQNL